MANLDGLWTRTPWRWPLWNNCTACRLSCSASSSSSDVPTSTGNGVSRCEGCPDGSVRDDISLMRGRKSACSRITLGKSLERVVIQVLVHEIYQWFVIKENCHFPRIFKI